MSSTASARRGASSPRYVYDNAKVTDGGPANAALNGKWLQQVPENRGSLQVAYSNAEVRDGDASACRSSACSTTTT